MRLKAMKRPTYGKLDCMFTHELWLKVFNRLQDSFHPASGKIPMRQGILKWTPNKMNHTLEQRSPGTRWEDEYESVHFKLVLSKVNNMLF